LRIESVSAGDAALEWFILFVIVPAILVPVVLLCGFAGCGVTLSITPEISVVPPTGLHATISESLRGIVLVWKNNEPDAARFEVRRTETRPPFHPPATPELLPDVITAPIFVDKTAAPGLTFKYQVRVFNSVGTASDFSNESSATMFPASPVVTATPKDVDQIDLSWAAPTNASIEHRSPPGSGTFVKIHEGPPPFEHKGLAPNSSHEYQVTAVVDGVSDFVPLQVASLPSVKQETTRSWEPYLSTSTAPLNPNGGVNAAGSCIVQRITGVMLAQPKQSIRISLKGVPGQMTKLTNVCISNALPATSTQPWDAADEPVDVTFAGKKGLTLLNDQVVASDKIRFALAPGKDLLIAIDVVVPTPSAAQPVQRRTVSGMTAYTKGNAAEASSQDRSQGYNDIDNSVYCIETIEVA
jgi:hypothetical protein